MPTTRLPVTLRRDRDIIRATVTVAGADRELGILIDGHEDWIIDPWLNTAHDVLGIAEAPVLDPAWLPSVQEARLIMALPVPDIDPRTESERTMSTPHTALDRYAVTEAGGGTVTARTLRDRAQAIGLTQIVAAIDRLAAHGTTYSYEDFDVLSRAARAIHLSEQLVRATERR